MTLFLLLYLVSYNPSKLECLTIKAAVSLYGEAAVTNYAKERKYTDDKIAAIKAKCLKTGGAK